MSVRVITVPEGQLSKAKAEAMEKNYIVRTHFSNYDNCWKLTLVDKEKADSWPQLVKDMRMITLAAPVWVCDESGKTKGQELPLSPLTDAAAAMD